MSSVSVTEQAEACVTKPRRAKDVVKGKGPRPPEALFDAFWREGELAMLFGEAGEGKSLLAVQVADAIARGEALVHNSECTVHNNGLKTRKKPIKTLYIDLVLSEKQFRERYSGYKFTTNLFRETPPAGVGLFEFVTAMIATHGIRAVIIDDLSLVSRTADGTREALALMHRLRQLTLATGVSILVLADTYPFVYEHQSPERGLRRSRVLCGVADSVFALYDGCVVQTRSRSGEKVWTLANKLRYTITELESGLLGMEFDPPEVDLRTSREIAEIKRMHDDEGMTFREIAAELDISKSQAQRLYTQWTPDLDAEVTERERQWDEEDAYNQELDEWTESGGKIMYDNEQDRWVKVVEDTDIEGSQA